MHKESIHAKNLATALKYGAIPSEIRKLSVSRDPVKTSLLATANREVHEAQFKAIYDGYLLTFEGQQGKSIHKQLAHVCATWRVWSAYSQVTSEGATPEVIKMQTSLWESLLDSVKQLKDIPHTYERAMRSLLPEEE